MAEDFDFQSRTEPPSPRRRERAHEEGRFAVSAELSTGLVLFVGVGALYLLARLLGGGLLAQTRFDLLNLTYTDLTTGAVQRLFVAKFWQALCIAGLVLGLLFLTTIAAGVGQVGFQMNFAHLSLNWERVQFQSGRLFSWHNLTRGLVLLGKIAAIAAVAWWVLARRGSEIAHLDNTSLAGAMAAAWNLVIGIAVALAGTLLAIGLADYVYQRVRFERSLYMTKQEVKEELKREEGNPQTRARIRKLQRETAQRKMFHQVRQATVVVTNPTHLAVALRYEAGVMAAPKVVAKGADLVAKRIVTLARQHGVPVVERKPLAQVLYKTVKLEQTIPIELYMVIAELMAYVYRLKGGMRAA
jgi:flagellar biosynthetic protein FlhB